MADNPRYEIIGEGQYRVLARVGGPMWNTDGIALAANDVIGAGEVPREKLVWADTGGRIIAKQLLIERPAPFLTRLPA